MSIVLPSNPRGSGYDTEVSSRFSTDADAAGGAGALAISSGAAVWVAGISSLAVSGPLLHFMRDVGTEPLGGPRTVLGNALARIGIPLDCVTLYEEVVAQRRFLLMIQGSLSSIRDAGDRLDQAGAVDVAVHFARP